jgi:uncharacterized protein YbjT (DUF2867 family)
MDRSGLTILVTGATGHQGGASARHLLADGWKVRALVRDSGKPAAQALADAGAELVVGDLLDRDSLDTAVAGVYGVHSVQTPFGSGFDAEETEGRNIADAALAAGVKHFVYSSVIGADLDAGMPWVVSKHHIEEYLHSLDLPLTILRPTTFIDSLLGQRESILDGTLTGFLSADEPHQWIAVDDIGRFVALAFEQPAEWIGRTVVIAGDELTGEQAAAALSLGFGVPVSYEHVPPPEGMPAPKPAEPGSPAPAKADIVWLREQLPDLTTLAEWALGQR